VSLLWYISDNGVSLNGVRFMSQKSTGKKVGVTVGVRLAPDVLEALQFVAGLSDRTTAQVLRGLVNEALAAPAASFPVGGCVRLVRARLNPRHK